ncbi:Gfo/Idh/MocA family protein [Robertkochia sediminum]|uniref:Gfo/Idh/MocA family protein n=1 Tax=Robertkochia sediminum TaxID=2785326 RepID=UPI001931BD46|nr:Gfo/Idh/MocA family oxidoreductase [Robertkochia sediminum]MBL7471543.1 Gfo/Idh/MocA family oxidoreductase [Robertkochia sediminum]
MAEQAKQIRWGIIGLGNIARELARDLALVPDAELVAVASHAAERAEDFAQEFGANYAFGSYQELFECEEVDVVYVATYHHLHARYSIEAMKYGKHVLCEKPAAINATEAEAMIEASRTNEVFFMEALWSRFNPSLRKIKEMVDEGALGTLRSVQADFCFYGLDADPKGRLLNPELAGGSLLDIGIYPVFLSYLLLGMPEKISAQSRFFHTGAEIQTSMILHHPWAQSVLHSSFAHTSDNRANICGEEGQIIVDPFWFQTTGFTLTREGKSQPFSFPLNGKGYTYEIEEVHQCIRGGKTESELWSHKDTLNLISLLDRIREIAGIDFPIATLE